MEHNQALNDMLDLFIKQYGQPATPFKLKADLHKFNQLATAAGITWGLINSQGNKLQAAKRIGMNRNTLRANLKNNPYAGGANKIDKLCKIDKMCKIDIANLINQE